MTKGLLYPSSVICTVGSLMTDDESGAGVTDQLTALPERFSRLILPRLAISV